jgi:hypothetical protein
MAGTAPASTTSTGPGSGRYKGSWAHKLVKMASHGLNTEQSEINKLYSRRPSPLCAGPTDFFRLK